MTETPKNTATMPILTVVLIIGALIIAGAVVLSRLGPGMHRGPSVYEMQRQAEIDIRTLTTAAASYQVDYNRFPAWSDIRHEKMNWHTVDDAPSFRRSVGGTPSSLTSPIAYMARMPEDPFNMTIPGNTYAYWSTDDAFVIWSQGPDMDYDIQYREMERLALTTATNVQNEEIFTFDEKAAREYLTKHQYDASNGSESSGDIWRLHKR